MMEKKTQCVGVQSCSVLQYIAVCCSVLQCVAVCCSVLQCVAVCCSMLQCVAVCCSVFQYVAVYLMSPYDTLYEILRRSLLKNGWNQTGMSVIKNSCF